jgi:hypothetical protein
LSKEIRSINIQTDPLPNSGTLRLNILTLALKTDVNKESLAKVLKGRAPNQIFIMRPDETAITRYLKTAVEGEEELSLHYWEIASLQPLQNVRLAVFSFTVLTRLASTVETANELRLIDDCISKAVISRASSSKAPTQKNHWWKVW